MKRPIRQLTLLTTLLVAAFVPAHAAVASPLEVLQDCADSDVFEQKHSRSDLNRARGEIPADLAEYATCRRLIAAALAAGGSKGGKDGSGPGGADANLTPAERRRAAKRKRAERRRLAAVEDALAPDDDDSGLVVGDDSSGGTPLPLILTLIALACLGIGGGVWYASRRNPAVANALRRVPLPGKRV
jgi:hypothetical protein